MFKAINCKKPNKLNLSGSHKMITPSSFLHDLSTLDDAQKYGNRIVYKSRERYLHSDPFLATINRNTNQNSNAYSNPAFAKYG